MIDNLEKKYPYLNDVRGAALEQMTTRELVIMLRGVCEANHDGDEDWKQDIRSAIVRVSEKTPSA